MADAKKVTIEITNAKVIVPQSVYEPEPKRYFGKVASIGEVIEVYEDVAEKLERNLQAARVTKDSPASIKDTLAAAEEAERQRRANLLTGDQTGGQTGDPTPTGTPDDSWKNDAIKKYADEKQIDLKGATVKADMLKAIAEAANA